jgi:hypothetical protein
VAAFDVTVFDGKDWWPLTSTVASGVRQPGAFRLSLQLDESGPLLGRTFLIQRPELGRTADVGRQTH